MANTRKFCLLTNSQGMSIILDGTQEQIFSSLKKAMKPKEEYTNYNNMRSQYYREVYRTKCVSLQGYKEPGTGLVTATMVLNLDDNYIIENINDTESLQLSNQLSQEES